MIPLRQILRELWQEKTRLVLTIIGIAWATLAISLMLSIGEGLRHTFGKAAAGMGQNVVFVMPGQTTFPYHGNPANLAVTINQNDVASFNQYQFPEKNISRQYSFPAMITFQKNSYPAQISAVDANFANIRNLTMQVGGRFIDQYDIKNARRVVVLGNDLATTLFAEKNPLLQTIMIANEPFQVIGVLQAKFVLAGPPDNFAAWIPSSTYVALAEPQHINRLVFATKHAYGIPLVETQLTEALAFNHGFNPTDNNLLQFKDFQDLQQNTNHLFMGMEIFLGIIGLITLIVAGVGITNVMLIAITHATKEIGVRMAIGARSAQILWHYLVEGLITTLIGGLLGFVATIIIIHLLKKIPIHGVFFQLLGKPIPILSYPIVFLIIIILGTIGFLAAYFPAKRATQIDPAIALRQE